MKKTAFKIHILYEFVEGPGGGGTQFLKALRRYFREAGVYSEGPEAAEVVLFNSHHCFDKVFELKKSYRNKTFIHRVGPVFRLARGDKALDELIHQFNELVADGTIFQSNWSQEKHLGFGMRKPEYETVILNAPDPDIFNPKHDEPFKGRKIKLIANSWSSNIRKGFDIYRFLDENLDFNKYIMTFIGNSPIEFKNIEWIKPIPSQGVADMLKEHDIYIMASSNDACSNGLIEALSCGLPAVAINDGGNPEIVDKAGELFRDERGVIEAIDKVAQNYRHYQQQISLPTIDEVGQAYYRFAQTIYEDYLSGSYIPKQVRLLNIVKSQRLSREIIRWKILNRFRALARNIINADFYAKSLHRRLLEQEIKKISLSGVMLDIGSKNRRYDDYFPDARIMAIDIEPELKDGSIIQCDARNICFKDNSFDNVISFETFEYVYQTEDVLREVKRVLKPGGMCYFSVPFLNPVHGGAGDIVRYTRRGWQELLQRYFDEVEIKSFGGRYLIIFDFWFDKVRKAGTFKKLALLPLALLLRSTCLFLNKKDDKESSERFVMGYLVAVKK